MATIDSKVADVLDKQPTSTDSDDEDALIAALEDDDDLSGLREQRLQQLHQEMTRAKTMKEAGTGHYTEIKDEKSIMDITTSTKLVVVHFAKSDFGRCGVMDGHLEYLAPRHFDTRFVKINVDNAPFLVTKLKVQILPCVISFIDGLGVDRILGFEGLGNGDKFTTKDLEARLFASGVLVRTKLADGGLKLLSKGSNQKEADEEDGER